MTFEIENIDTTHPIYLALVEVQQARSRFQLEKFVVGQHDTLEAQYKQTLLEIQKLIHTIKIVTLQLKKQTIEIDRLRNEQDEIKTIDAEIVEVEQEQTCLALIGAKKELKDLLQIWDSFPEKYTHEQLENNQADYWDLRLTRQAQLEALGQDGKVGWSSLDSLRQIGKLKPSEIETVEQKEIN